MFKYVVLLALVPAILATTGVKSCRDNSPMPKTVDVAGCDATPCSIALGTKAQMTLGFEARKSPPSLSGPQTVFSTSSPSPLPARDIESFSPKVEAGVLGLWIDYALPDDVTNGCDALNGTRCPLDASENVVYDFLFPVDNSYPKISVDVELSLNDKEGKFLCVLIPIKVV